MTPPASITEDKFLGGRIVLRQPRDGYRAGIDPVLLAAAVPARAGQSVLDLGCGVGAAALCLGARVAGLDLSGVERQVPYADLARQNARANGIALAVSDADLSDLPADLRGRSFDHVIMNPPYHLRHQRTLAGDAAREDALSEDTPLPVWIDVATRRLAPRGVLTVIQKAERLPALFTALDDRLGDVVIRPLTPRSGRDAVLVLLQARKGGRGAARLAAPLVLHQGERHTHDGESYRDEVGAILRDALPLPM